MTLLSTHGASQRFLISLIFQYDTANASIHFYTYKIEKPKNGNPVSDKEKTHNNRTDLV